MTKPALSLNPAPPEGGVWPTPGQELLLQAALLEAPAAPQAWQRWKAIERTDLLDQASWKLLPTTYLNLTRLGVHDSLVDEARTIHRHYWARNQTHFHRSRQFLEELKSLEIPALVLKGVALSHLYYRDGGARPMADLDLLVPADKFSFLAKYLVQNGWQEGEDFSFIYFDQDAFPSFEFRRNDGFSVDLHAHVLHTDCRKEADAPFWDRACSWDFKGHPALTLCPEDHLLHAVSHGVAWNPVPPCRWIVDVWWILHATGSAFKWDRVIEQARFHQNALWIYHGLERMQKIVPLDLPTGVLDELKSTPATMKRRINFAYALLPRPLKAADRIKSVWKELEKDEPNTSSARKLANFRDYLMEAWGVSSVFLLPFVAGLKVVNFFWHKFRIYATPHPQLKYVLPPIRAAILFWSKLGDWFRHKPAP